MRASWIDASRQPVVPGTSVHAMAFTPLFLFVVWWSWPTLLFVILSSGAMVYVQLKGRQPVWLVRNLKSRLRGGRVQARPMWYRRRRTRLESYQSLDVHQAYALTGLSAPDPKRPSPRGGTLPANQAKP